MYIYCAKDLMEYFLEKGFILVEQTDKLAVFKFEERYHDLSLQVKKRCKLSDILKLIF